MLSLIHILRVLEIFIYNQNTLRYASTPDAVLIAAVVRAASNTTDVDTKDMELRMKKLEQRVEKLAAGIARSGFDTAAKQAMPPGRKALASETKPAEEEKTIPQASAAIKSVEAGEHSEEAEREKAADVNEDAALKEFKALVSQAFPVLGPASGCLKKLAARGSILDLYADEADSALTDMLKKEEYAEQMGAITTRIFGHPMIVDIVYEKEQKEEKSMQEQLAELVGKDKVIIK